MRQILHKFKPLRLAVLSLLGLWLAFLNPASVVTNPSPAIAGPVAAGGEGEIGEGIAKLTAREAGERGEKQIPIALAYLYRKGELEGDLATLGFYNKTLTHATTEHGFDGFVIGSQNKSYHIVESKATSSKGVFSSSSLKKDTNQIRQLSPDWVSTRISTAQERVDREIAKIRPNIETGQLSGQQLAEAQSRLADLQAFRRQLDIFAQKSAQNQTKVERTLVITRLKGVDGPIENSVSDTILHGMDNQGQPVADHVVTVLVSSDGKVKQVFVHK